MTDAAIVTGAASGIGRATVDQLRERYDLVAGIDIDDAIDEVAAEFDDVAGYVADVRDHKRVHGIVDDVEGQGDVVAVINNAAISRYEWIGNLGPEEWQEVLDVNLTGQYNLVHAVAPRMYKREHGAIVNVSSGAGKRGSASGGVHYSASKAGIFGLTKGLAKQLGPHVRVNCIVPGLIDTPLTTGSGLWTNEEINAFTDDVPLGRLGQPEEVAALIDFLCSERASYMTGAVVDVDGGATL
ncbi:MULTISPECIES: SDR family NAD(P)-dependent oxidoreductase [Halorubrum]|uniref:3-oxoacyl-ACP reductase n=1 Tax=Halorubrum ezzemoulense TaxID=337243 RepID=A0A256JL34_HALEZ|nr:MULTISPECIES: SDR family NAD(P)-dependent oxidoreductase [Halorubrum]MDB2282716.1 SDR family NAD(P)-dependent oxidoreductase [Halorubrum ezzemoulense]OYR68957.1 3-oxoacyl-ACP reductase [Halorubrum ezzemoulense]TKX37687.1 SDR family oxidoreductase [Halorubrum sp. CGM5_25_10-8B]